MIFFDVALRRNCLDFLYLKHLNLSKYIAFDRFECWLFHLQANLSAESEEIFKFMHDQGIGTELSCFYESWANVTELGGHTKKADSIYQLGINRAAQPLSQLQRKHEYVSIYIVQAKCHEDWPCKCWMKSYLESCLWDKINQDKLSGFLVQ